MPRRRIGANPLLQNATEQLARVFAAGLRDDSRQLGPAPRRRVRPCAQRPERAVEPAEVLERPGHRAEALGLVEISASPGNRASELVEVALLELLLRELEHRAETALDCILRQAERLSDHLVRIDRSVRRRDPSGGEKRNQSETGSDESSALHLRLLVLRVVGQTRRARPTLRWFMSEQ